MSVSSTYRGDWRTAKDPKSGKIYYYNCKTKETTWKMPLEMASTAEQEKTKRKQEEKKQFFREMEENIRRKMRGEEPITQKSSYETSRPSVTIQRPSMRRESSSEYNRVNTLILDNNEIGLSSFNRDRRDSNPGANVAVNGGGIGERRDSMGTSSDDINAVVTKPYRYRTISTIDDEVIELLKYTKLEEGKKKSDISGNVIGRKNSGSGGTTTEENNIATKNSTTVFTATESRRNSSTIDGLPSTNNGTGSLVRGESIGEDNRVRAFSNLGYTLDDMATEVKGDDRVIMGKRNGNKLSIHEVAFPAGMNNESVIASCSSPTIAKMEICNMAATIVNLTPSKVSSGAQKLVETSNNNASLGVKQNANLEKNRKRRNSTGTIYVETTMSCQDNSMMIHVVCVVIRAHMLAASRRLSITQQSKCDSNNSGHHHPYQVFNDDYVSPEPVTRGNRNSADSFDSDFGSGNNTSRTRSNTLIPSMHTSGNNSSNNMDLNTSLNTNTAHDTGNMSSLLETSSDTKDDDQPPPPVKIPSLKCIKEFFHSIYSKSQLESECIIMTLIYVERLIVKTKGSLYIRDYNWKAILFACIVMASKVWDDLSMWNVDFSNVSAKLFDLRRVNELELALLDAFSYEVKVSASDYAKYYFQLRSLMARLGFTGAGSKRSHKQTSCKNNEKSENDSESDEDEDEEDFDESNSLSFKGHRGSSFELKPLDIEGAMRLQLATEKFEFDVSSSSPSNRTGGVPNGDSAVLRGRSYSSAGNYYSSGFAANDNTKQDGKIEGGDETSKSVSTATVPVPLTLRRFRSDVVSLGRGGVGSSGGKGSTHHHHPVLLEQLIHSQHNDADGVAHISKINTPVPMK